MKLLVGDTFKAMVLFGVACGGPADHCQSTIRREFHSCDYVNLAGRNRQ